MRLFNAATRINTRTKTQKESVKQICNSKKEGNQMNPEEKIRGSSDRHHQQDIKYLNNI